MFLYLLFDCAYLGVWLLRTQTIRVNKTYVNNDKYNKRRNAAATTTNNDNNTNNNNNNDNDNNDYHNHNNTHNRTQTRETHSELTNEFMT